MDSLEYNITWQASHSFEFNLYDKEIFTWYAITFWIDGALKHFKLALNTQVNSIVFDCWTILKVLSFHCLYIHEVWDIPFLIQEHFVFQFEQMITQEIF